MLHCPETGNQDLQGQQTLGRLVWTGPAAGETFHRPFVQGQPREPAELMSSLRKALNPDCAACMMWNQESATTFMIQLGTGIQK